jgi:hypothetical protein
MCSEPPSSVFLGHARLRFTAVTLLTEKPLAGTGLKIKSVEALCRAKPLVAGPNSVEGLLSAGEPSVIMCRIWTTFSDAVITLLESEDKRFELQRQV